MSNHNTYICSLKSLPYKILIYWAMCFAKFLHKSGVLKYIISVLVNFHHILTHLWEQKNVSVGTMVSAL